MSQISLAMMMFIMQGLRKMLIMKRVTLQNRFNDENSNEQTNGEKTKMSRLRENLSGLENPNEKTNGEQTKMSRLRENLSGLETRVASFTVQSTMNFPASSWNGWKSDRAGSIYFPTN
ncbi:hypothetical protein M0802_014300 [Mischocyttarus mexicanus]|nr:hypothetical protein M0802_016382 [Mischocyttarus mexicanus]KAI4472997.1 hypothetical protein M0802_016375 [Mischocyttarus mexicanus]KAI4475395.1 hypothetical protein M0802_015165 [Mischocyttarus mexicanus]KAI4478260.1 hypothetical protein M0802_014557 [Mischocyttarus mexicanus]KAI4480016.1 hypothetical protein M0802_014300 [Mischocyttarus mexicanus]